MRYKEKLYKALSEEYDLGTFEQFSADLDNEEKRRKLYDATSDDYDYGDYESFSAQLGYKEPFKMAEPFDMNKANEESLAGLTAPQQQAYVPSPSTDSQYEGQAPVVEQAPRRGFKAGMQESWKGLKAGTQFAYGEVVNGIFGSSQDDANALYELNEMLRQGKDVASEVEGAWTDAGREIRTGALEFLPGWAIKGLKDRVYKEAEHQKILDDIREVLGETNGDVAKARQILEERAMDLSHGDRVKLDAQRQFGNIRETEGFGAWLGENTVQMIPSASALIVGALTKSPAAARAIGMIGMGGMTAATSGSSMYEAREAGASDLETHKVGVVDGAIEYITEKLPFDNYTNWMVGKTKGKVATEVARALRSKNSPVRAEMEELLTMANKELGGKLFSKKNAAAYIADMVAEGASEFTAEASQTMTRLMYDNPDLFPLLGEALANGWQGALAGFFMGGVLGGASKTMEHHQNRERRQKQGYVDVGLVNFGTAENPDNDIVEVISVFEDTDLAQVLRDGAIINVNKNAIGQQYRYSYEAFEAGRMRVLESEALDNESVTQGMIQAADSREATAQQNLVEALRASGMADDEIMTLLDDADADKIRMFDSPDIENAYNIYRDARHRARELRRTSARQAQSALNLKRLSIEENAGQFWRDNQTEDANGNPIFNPTVETGLMQDGTRVYVLSDVNEQGECAAVTENGEKKIIKADMLQDGTQVFTLDEYLQSLVDADKVQQEQTRMVEQTQDRMTQARQAAQPGTQINLGTEEDPVIGSIVEQGPDGVIVQSEAGASQLTWDEYANAMHIGAPALTDNETAGVEAAEILSAESAYNNEVAQTESEAKEVADESGAALQEFEQADPLPRDAEGNVDETTLWNDSPARWAEWNDEQRQDGGANSIQAIDAAVAKLSATIAEQQAAYGAMPVGKERNAVEQEIASLQERLAELLNVQQRYVAPVAEEVTETAAEAPAAEVAEEPAVEAANPVRETLTQLYNDPELSESEIEAFINANVQESQKALDKHLDKAPKMGTDMAKYKADRAKHQAKTAELEKQRDFWREVQSYIEMPDVTEMDMEPQNALEFTANELTRKDGVKLQRDSFTRHTGYGSEAGNFLSMLRTKQNGGLTLEEAGERLMEMDRENGTGFFDQSDPNAGLNAILEVIGGARTSGDVSGYIKANREQLAREEMAAARNAMMEEMTQQETAPAENIIDNVESDLPEDIFMRTVDETEAIGGAATVKGRAEAWEKRLGIKVNVLEDVSQVKNRAIRKAIERGLQAPGWFDRATGEVCIYAPQIPNMSEVDKTVIHEVISHKGLRGLLGEEGFNALCDYVWQNMKPEARAKYFTYEGVLKGERKAEYSANPEAFIPTEKESRAAADEFIAGYSESMNTDKNAWQKMIDSVKRFINKLTRNYSLVDQLDELLDASLARYETIAKMDLQGVVEEGQTYGGIIDAETGAKIDASSDIQAEGEDARFRITPEMDAEYLRAVEAGDMETAQRMVNEAAKLAMPNTLVVDENGNPKVVYHGSTAMFTVFDKSRIGSATGTADGRGFYFTTDRDYALGYKTSDGQLFEVFLNIEKPLSYDKKTITKSQLRKILKEADRVEYEQEGEHYMLSNYANYYDVGIDAAVNEAANLEYDYADNDVELVGSLIGGSGSFDLIMDAVKKVTGKSGMIAPKDNGTVHYVVTNPAAIKAADPVTYDDNGNVIPLSERFNPENEDIRFRVLDTTKAELKDKPIKLNGMYRFKVKSAFKGVKDNGGSYLYLRAQIIEMYEGYDGPAIKFDGILEGSADIFVPKGTVTEGEKDNEFFIDPKAIESQLWDVLRSAENYYEYKYADGPYRKGNWLDGEEIRFRVRGENESAVDFCLACADDVRAKYRIDAKMRVAEVNEKNAKILGYKDGEITDQAIYLPEYNMIIIFAHEDWENGIDIECAIFHEIIHKYEDPAVGEWLWNHSDGIQHLADLKRSIIEGYPEDEFSNEDRFNEMLCDSLSIAMTSGTAQAFYNSLPEEHKVTVDNILNEIRYDRERESTERVRRSAGESSIGESGDESISGKKGPEAGGQSGIQETNRETAEGGAGRSYQESEMAEADSVSETSGESESQAQETDSEGLSFRVTDINPEVRAEMNTISAIALVNGTYLKAPNGADTNLTPEQWALVRTKNFLRWFGDWINNPENASKVVDENGEPKVVYHGSATSGITAFDKSRIRAGETDANYNGFWFSTDEDTLPAWVRKEARYDVFLKLVNPISDKEAEIISKEVLLSDKDYAGARSLADATRFELQSRGYDGVLHQTHPDIDFVKLENDGYVEFETSRGARYLIERNPESVYEIYRYSKYEEDHKGAFYGDFDTIEDIKKDPYFFGEEIYVVFEPSQIKSATDNTGEFSDEDGDIRYRISNDSETGIESLVERTFRTSGAFSFSGKEKIESRDDVAFIFKQLEDSAIENSFLVFVKDGIPTVIHVGMGGTSYTMIDNSVVLPAYKDFGADKIYMVHNHPSGSLYASKADLDSLKTISMQIPDVSVEGIIINTVSGEYASFDLSSSTQSPIPTDEGTVPVKVLSFDKNVFAPDYKSKINERKIKGSDDVASFLSAHRLGEGTKVGALLLNRQNMINGNLVTNDNEVSVENADTLASQIAEAANRTGSSAVILFGDFDYSDRAVRSLSKGIKRASGNTIDLLDVVRLEGNHTLSMADETLPSRSTLGDGIRFRTREEAQELLNLMQENAETLIPRQLTEDIWKEEIEGRTFSSPIGTVRLGHNQFDKNINKGRAREFGMLIPTIERPDLIFEESAPEEGAERQTKYVFVKTFIDESGAKHINYASISVQKEGMEVVESSHRLRDKQVLNKIEKEQMLWNRFASDSTSSAPGISTDQSNALSDSKDNDYLDTDNEYDENISYRITGTPTEQVVEEGVSLSPADMARVAGRIFSVLPEEARREVTASLNGNILGLQDAIMQIPARLAMKQDWDEQDMAVAEAIAAEMDRITPDKTRPFSTYEGLWMLYDALNPASSLNLMDQASRAIVKRNLGVDEATLERMKKDADDVRFRATETAEVDALVGAYNQSASFWKNRLYEVFVDQYDSVDGLVKSIEESTGMKAKSFEDVVSALNQMPAKSGAKTTQMVRKYIIPMWDAIKELVTKYDLTEAKIARYTKLKHGLERNEEFPRRDARAFYRAAFEKKIASINADKSLSGAEKDAQKKKAQDDLDFHFASIESGSDAKFQEFREKDYSGIMAMYEDSYDNLADAEEAAKAEVESFEDGKENEIKELWKRINALNKATLKVQYETGQIGKAAYESLKEQFKYYVPLRGFEKETAEDQFSYYAREFSSFEAAVLKAKGRKTEAESPFGHMGAMMASAIVAGEKNEAKLALYYFALNRKDNGLLTIKDVWYIKREDSDAWELSLPPVKGEGESVADYGQRMDAWEDRMKTLQGEGKAKKGKQNLNLADIVHIDDSSEREHYIRVQVAGQEKWMIINGNPRAAQAINGLLNLESDPYFNKFFGKVMRELAQLSTSYNPEFWMTNLERDFMTTFATVVISEDAEYRKAFFKNYKEAWKVVKMLPKLKDGTLGDTGIEGILKEAVAGGLQTGFSHIKANEVWDKEMEQHFQDLDAGKAKQAIRSTFDKLQNLSESMELVSRFAVYMTSRQMGKSVAEAVADGKEVTANFNRKGSGRAISFEEAKKITTRSGKTFREEYGEIRGAIAEALIVAVSRFAEFGRKYILFFNASVQGLDKWFRLARRNKGNARKLAAYFGGQFALGFIMSLLYGMLDDDDEYQENVSDYDRRNNFMIGGNGYYIKVALPHDVRTFYGMGDIFYNYVSGNYKHHSVKEAAKTVAKQAGSLLPVNPFNGWSEFVPAFIKPIIEAGAPFNAFGIEGTNENFAGMPIRKETPWLTDEDLERTPKYTLAGDYTWDWLVNVSEALNRVTGGTYKEAGKIDIDPARIQHYIEGWTGGVGRTTGNFATFISQLIGEEEWKAANTPFLNKILTITDERSQNRLSNDQFYHYSDVGEAALSRAKAYEKDGEMELLAKEVKSDEYKIGFIYTDKKKERQYKKTEEMYRKQLKEAKDEAEEKRIKELRDANRKRFLKELEDLDLL